MWRPGQSRDKDKSPRTSQPRRFIVVDPKRGAAPSVMPQQPTPIHERRDRRKLASATRQAAMHATPVEFVELRRLIEATHTGHVTVTDARAAVAELRRLQQVRNGWPRSTGAHDPDDCTLMVCPDPACVGRNVGRGPQGAGNSSPFRRAA